MNRYWGRGFPQRLAAKRGLQQPGEGFKTSFVAPASSSRKCFCAQTEIRVTVVSPAGETVGGDDPLCTPPCRENLPFVEAENE